MPEPLNEATVRQIALAVLSTIQPALEGGRPGTGTRTLEILNALAFSLCPIFAGTGFDPAALEFFRRCLAENALMMAVERKINFAMPDWLADASGKESADG